VEPVSQSYNILDSMVSKQADGKMRRVSEFTVVIKGRTG
jgi:hypothetical protein